MRFKSFLLSRLDNRCIVFRHTSLVVATRNELYPSDIGLRGVFKRKRNISACAIPQGSFPFDSPPVSKRNSSLCSYLIFFQFSCSAAAVVHVPANPLAVIFYFTRCLDIEMVLSNQNNCHLKTCVKYSDEHVTCIYFTFMSSKNKKHFCPVMRLDWI